MKPDQKIQWILKTRGRTWNAIHRLQAAKKQVSGEYDERLRKMRNLEQDLYIQESDATQGELFDVESLVSPDIEKLLASPLHGLD